MHHTDPDEYRPQILDPRDSADATVLDRLRSEPHVQTLDHHGAELDNLRRLRPEPAAALLDEPGRWVWYPWRRTLVSIPGPRGFKALRLDRNRNAVTVEDGRRLDHAHRRQCVANPLALAALAALVLLAFLSF